MPGSTINTDISIGGSIINKYEFASDGEPANLRTAKAAGLKDTKEELTGLNTGWEETASINTSAAF